MLKLFKNIYKINNFYQEAQSIFKKRNWSQALALYNKSIEVQPTYNLAYLGKTKCYINMSKIQQAVQNLSYFETTKPSGKGLEELFIVKGRLSLSQNNFEQAINFFQNAIDLNQSDQFRASIYKLYCLSNTKKLKQYFDKIVIIQKSKQTKNLKFEIAWIYFTIKNFSQAIKIFTELAITQNNHFVYFYKGSAQRNLGNIQQAQKSLRKSISIQDDFLDSILALSDVLIMKQQIEEALKLSLKGIQINPKIQYSYFNRSLCYFKLARYQQAIQSFTQAISIQQNPFSFFHRGICYSILGRFKQAEADFNKKLQLTPQHPQNIQVYLNLGMIHFKQQKYQLAMSQYQKCEKLNPNYPELFHQKGNCLTVMGKKQQGYKYLQKALAGDPTNFMTKMSIVGHHMIYKQFDTAYKLIKQIAAQNPEDIQILLAQSNVEVELNLIEQSLNTLNKALKVDPEDDLVLSSKALILNRLKRNDESELIFKDLIKRFPQELSFYVNRSFVLKQLGRMQQAEENLEQALKIAPKQQFLLNARRQLFGK